MASDELRFKHIGLSSDGAVIFCELDNGKTYPMPVAALDRAEDWNPEARPKTVGILHDGYAAFVKFDNKITIDFPADFVLHICEPAYTWYKDKGRAASGVGRRIREIREARGMTLDALSKKCGIAKPNLSRLEHDKVTPKLETLRTVAAGLGIHPTLLLRRHALKRTLVEFREWKRGLLDTNGKGVTMVKGPELVSVFLATRPEHQYAENDLLSYADGTRHLSAKKWAKENAAANDESVTS